MLDPGHEGPGQGVVRAAGPGHAWTKPVWPRAGETAVGVSKTQAARRNAERILEMWARIVATPSGAGADVVDEAVIVDDRLVPSRMPDVQLRRQSRLHTRERLTS